MSIEIKVPELPESIADAIVAGWYKSVGDNIAQDEVLVDLETDKVVLEVPAIQSGVVSAIHFKQGDTVTAGEVLAIIDEASTSVESDSTAPEKMSALEQSEKKDTERKIKGAAMSPSVRRLMAENNINAEDVVGTGKNGRVLKQDVEAAMKNKVGSEKSAGVVDEATAAQSTTVAQKNAVVPSASATPLSMPATGERLERRVPMTRLRRRIAERLVQAQQNAAILTTFNEVNMQPVIDIRSRYKEAFLKKYDVKLGFMSFFVQACVEALKRFPEINASVDGNDIVYHGFYDIGVAVSAPNGLVVPVLRDADLMSLAQVEQSIIEYGNRAKNNRLTIEDITGGTFTISNGGVFGSMLSTPILNPPQSAILGMHNIQQRAMVIDGEIVALPVMYLALSYDHRLIDGKSAVQFLVTVKQLLEDPSRILLGL